jgi:uncharacterized delta-60 repeat protein
MRNILNVLLIGAVLALISLSVQPAAAQAGQLDSLFGQGGKVITNFSSLNPGGQVNGVPSAILQQPDDKLVVAGSIVDGTTNLANEAVALVRYLPNGQLDLTFGNRGIAVAAFDQGSFSTGFSLALMPDGRIVVCGEDVSSDGSFDRFGVARFNPNGTLDTTFGGKGTVTTEFFAVPQPGVREAAFAVVVQSDGKIVAAGSTSQTGKAPIQTALARYNIDGSLDSSFGRGGKVLTSIPGPAQSVALLANDHIQVLSGSSISEFSANGALLQSVQGGSIISTSFGGSETFQVDDKFQQVKLFSVNRRTLIPDVVRFLDSGSADQTFKNPPFNFGGNNTVSGTANGIVMQPDGKSVVGGSTQGLFGVARLNIDGTLDSTFGNKGSITTAFPSTAAVTAIGLQSDGKIVAAGLFLDSTGAANFAIARYLGR